MSNLGGINMHLVSKILFVIAIGLLCYCQYLASQPTQINPRAEQIFLQQYQDFKNWRKIK